MKHMWCKPEIKLYRTQNVILQVSLSGRADHASCATRGSMSAPHSCCSGLRGHGRTAGDDLVICCSTDIGLVAAGGLPSSSPRAVKGCGSPSDPWLLCTAKQKDINYGRIKGI
jgi:hypothetical protein